MLFKIISFRQMYAKSYTKFILFNTKNYTVNIDNHNPQFFRKNDYTFAVENKQGAKIIRSWYDVVNFYF